MISYQVCLFFTQKKLMQQLNINDCDPPNFTLLKYLTKFRPQFSLFAFTLQNYGPPALHDGTAAHAPTPVERAPRPRNPSVASQL